MAITMKSLSEPQRRGLQGVGRDYIHFHQASGGGRSERDRFKRTVIHPATLTWLRSHGLVEIASGWTLLSLTDQGRVLYTETTGRKPVH
jgi:hypothetical protein